ncbi:unannotated protein [freshwater metagenome]|uniref:Unannotated protein n=1 Tax=freshwater metagenome TaxID=449393 RepID=A0A6J6F6Q5_9ZZZZ
MRSINRVIFTQLLLIFELIANIHEKSAGEFIHGWRAGGDDHRPRHLRLHYRVTESLYPRETDMYPVIREQIIDLTIGEIPRDHPDIRLLRIHELLVLFRVDRDGERRVFWPPFVRHQLSILVYRAPGQEETRLAVATAEKVSFPRAPSYVFHGWMPRDFTEDPLGISRLNPDLVERRNIG